MAKERASRPMKRDFAEDINLARARFISDHIVSVVVFVCLIFLMTASGLRAQEPPAVADSTVVPDSLALALTPRPPLELTGADRPNDAGKAVVVRWQASPDDLAGEKVQFYRIYRAEEKDGQPGEFTEIDQRPSGDSSYSLADGKTVDGTNFYYRIVALNQLKDSLGVVIAEYVSEPLTAGPFTSSAQWINLERINALVGVAVLSFFILLFINQAKSGKSLFVRKIGGLEAVNEAVGRATEMGRSIFYISGIGDMDNMQTIAAITILGRVAEISARYETFLDVPVCRSMVMVTAREVVKESYSKAGRPDAYKDDQVHYLTDDQFGYAAAVDGMVVRERPATIFLMGQFFAESLILAETGNSIGAIQIAGTAMPSQLPFFVAACDYTLIGEELFAASAYLSKEPRQLGSIKGADIGKAVILVAIVVGLILEVFGIWQFSNLFSVIDK